MKIKHQSNADDRRRKEYPEAGDQLDALWKFIQSLPINQVPVEVQVMMQRVRGVKDKFPKQGKV